MYLSKLVLNPRCKQALKEVDDPYQMHRTLARAFGDKLREARLLFRVDGTENTGPYVIAQSLVEPNWTALPVSYAEVNSKEVVLQLEVGLTLAFRLLARPTKRDKESGRRASLRGEEALKGWLERKALAAGFKVASLRMNETRWCDSKGGRPSQAINAVQFDGVLVVTDPDKLYEAVRNGIGPQKAFGFGLLSLAPLKDNTVG